MDRENLITSLQNSKVKETLRLRDRPDRDQQRLFLVEGYRELLRFTDNGGKAEALFYCPEQFLGSNEKALIDKIAAKGALLYRCSPHVFAKLSYRDRPDGLLAVAQQKHRNLNDLQKVLPTDKAPFLVVAESIEKPGNLGTILRTSDASGVNGVIVCDRCTDIYNPNVVRASVGTLFTVPVVEASGEETLRWLKRQGIQIVAATPGAEMEYTEVDFTRPVAIAVGTEQLGLSERWMDGADLKVKIPMCGVADSLNVAMAATILLFEVRRQRKNG